MLIHQVYVQELGVYTKTWCFTRKSPNIRGSFSARILVYKGVFYK